jgi:oxysterol-binding protein-related protein 3/6/7
VPVYFNEPLSMLQKTGEVLQNEHLISKAAEEEDSLMRMLHVAAFSISQYGGTQFRCSKPFNPILGETFEMKAKNWKFVAEQVSHHPPISACYVDHKKYELWANSHLKTKFWGKSLEFKPLGNINIKFKDNDDHFIIARPNSLVQNIIIGNMYIDHTGDSLVVNKRTGEKAIVKFKALGFFQNKKNRGKITASIHNSAGEEVYEIFGKWTESIFYRRVGDKKDEGTLLWSFPDIPEDWESIYHFTDFTLQLNMLTDDMAQILPPTDSRFRSDQRMLENGQLKQANNEKQRLEEKQRRRRKIMEDEGIEHAPRYFYKYDDPEIIEKNEDIVEYRPLHNYWEFRDKQDWKDLPDLFGPDTPENSDEEN